MNITKDEVQQVLSVLQEEADIYSEVPESFQEAISLLQSKLEKDDGEPVAWLYWNKESKELRVCQLAEHDADDFPVFTHPAKQTPWVGLTDEEVNDLYNAGMGIHATIEATEEKLKEKNT